MKAIELLEKYPLTTEVVRDWFIRKMVESVNEDNDVPEDFKKFMIEEGVSNDRLCMFIDANPRSLFDVFDENDLFIEIFMYPDVTFTCKIGDKATTNSWKTRKEAEMFAVEAAFEMLEKKLTPAPEQIDVQGEEIVKE